MCYAFFVPVARGCLFHPHPRHAREEEDCKGEPQGDLLQGGGGMARRPGEGGGGGLEKWAPMPALWVVERWMLALEHKFWPEKVLSSKVFSPTYV